MNNRPVRKFKAKILNNKLVLPSTKLFRENLKNFEGKEVELIIQRYRKTRTLKQNAYYWGAIIPILAEHFGYEDEEMHEALKWIFLKKRLAPIPTVISTTTLNTAQFIDYIERIKRWATINYNIVLPDPEELFIEMSEELEIEVKKRQSRF